MDTDDKYEFTPAEKSQPPRRNKVQCYMGISLVLLSVAVLAAVASMIWQTVSFTDRFKNMTVVCQSEDVVVRFPGYFRTPEQQAEIELITNTTAQPFTIPVLNCTNYFGRQRRGIMRLFSSKKTSEREHGRSKRAASKADPIYNACCKSTRTWVQPDTATNLMGDSVEVVQLPKHKQYFEQESCEPIAGCTVCTCAQPQPFLVNAIVYKDKNANSPAEKYKQDIITFPGCCKCLNIGV